MKPLRIKAKTLFWILHFGGWTALGVSWVLNYYKTETGTPRVLLGVFLTYISGSLASLLLRPVYRKIPFEKHGFSFIGLIALSSSILITNCWIWLDTVMSAPLFGWDRLLERWTFRSYMFRLTSSSTVMSAYSALYLGIRFWRAWSAEREKTAKANTLAQTAQLQMLRYQLNPHFLFNALNSIRALIEEDKTTARTMITELAEFLRYSLISKTYTDVPLKHELEAIRHYLAIEKKRYEDKLDVRFQIEPQAEEFPVLSFLLNPLLENALKYGMATSQMPLCINIVAAVRNRTLVLDVTNSGAWIETRQESAGTGLGLDNIRKRLENAFPGMHRLEIMKNPDSVRVHLEITRQIEVSHEEKDSRAHH